MKYEYVLKIALLRANQETYIFKLTLLRSNQKIYIRLQSNLIKGQSRNINTSSKQPY